MFDHAVTAAAHERSDLYPRGFRLYKRFRPEVLRARVQDSVRHRSAIICSRMRRSDPMTGRDPCSPRRIAVLSLP